MPVSRFRHLTDEELLVELEEKRQSSPIIDELCTRLRYYTGDMIPFVRSKSTICPICESDINVKLHHIDDDLIELSLAVK